LQSCNHSYWYYAEYSTFRVLSEADNYKLKVAGYSGNTGYNALAYVDDRMFTTYVRDNDLTVKNCAANNGGGFWYSACAYCSVTGVSFNCTYLDGGGHPSPLQSSRKCK